MLRGTLSGTLAALAAGVIPRAPGGESGPAQTDFVADGVLGGDITFTRASTGTYFDSAGVMQTAAIDAPRIDHNPHDFSLRGLLIEEERTNLLTYSVLTGGTPPTDWTRGGSGGTITASDSDRLSSAKKLRFAITSTARDYIEQNVSVSANTTYVLSLWYFGHTGNPRIDEVIHFDSAPSGSTITLYINGASQFSDALLSTDEWFQLQAVIAVGGTSGSVNARLGVNVQTARHATLDATFELPQFEQGSFQTSFIPTTSAAVTRSGDVSRTTDLSWLDWSDSAGSLWVHLRSMSSATGQFIAFIGDVVGFSQYVYLDFDSGNLRGRTADASGNTQTGGSAGGFSLGSRRAVGVSWDTDSTLVTVNDGESNTSGNGRTPQKSAFDRLEIGNLDEFGQFNGWITDLRYYNYKLSHSEMAALY